MPELERDALDRVARNLAAERFARRAATGSITQAEARRLLHEIRQYAHAVKLLADAHARYRCELSRAEVKDGYLATLKREIHSNRQSEHEQWLALKEQIISMIASME